MVQFNIILLVVKAVCFQKTEVNPKRIYQSQVAIEYCFLYTSNRVNISDNSTNIF